jgi:3-hydroxy-3-methylglutaryl CoA synthase
VAAVALALLIAQKFAVLGAPAHVIKMVIMAFKAALNGATLTALMQQVVVVEQNGCAASIVIAKLGKALASKDVIETDQAAGAVVVITKVAVLINIGATELLQMVMDILTILTFNKVLARVDMHGTTYTKCKAAELAVDQ